MQKTYRTHASAEKAVMRVRDAVQAIFARCAGADLPESEGGEGLGLETLTIFNDRIVIVHVDSRHVDEIKAVL